MLKSETLKPKHVETYAHEKVKFLPFQGKLKIDRIHGDRRKRDRYFLTFVKLIIRLLRHHESHKDGKPFLPFRRSSLDGGVHL